MLVKTHSILQPGLAQTWSDLAEVQNQFDRIFRWGLNEGANGYYPPANVSETDDAYLVEARVPGLAKEDITLELEGRVLTIRGEHKREAAQFSRQERASGRFERKVTFKHALTTDAIKAEVKDGILVVTLPKAEEAKPRKIEIQAR